MGEKDINKSYYTQYQYRIFIRELRLLKDDSEILRKIDEKRLKRIRFINKIKKYIFNSRLYKKAPRIIRMGLYEDIATKTYEIDELVLMQIATVEKSIMFFNHIADYYDQYIRHRETYYRTEYREILHEARDIVRDLSLGVMYTNVGMYLCEKVSNSFERVGLSFYDEISGHSIKKYEANSDIDLEMLFGA